MRGIHLGSTLRSTIDVDVRRAFPRECCGLVEGVRDGEIIRTTQLHSTLNIARDHNRFEIYPADQFRVLRAARGREAGIVGCYHSHPNGGCELSDLDRECASQEGFVWLIAAWPGYGDVQLRAFIAHNNNFEDFAILDNSSPLRRPSTSNLLTVRSA